jgi:hypothetical protein
LVGEQTRPSENRARTGHPQFRYHPLPHSLGHPPIYEKIKPHQERAIRNAAKLEKYWNDSRKAYPERQNPSSSIHKIVEYLNELADLGNVD